MVPQLLDIASIALLISSVVLLQRAYRRHGPPTPPMVVGKPQEIPMAVVGYAQ